VSRVLVGRGKITSKSNVCVSRFSRGIDAKEKKGARKQMKNRNGRFGPPGLAEAQTFL